MAQESLFMSRRTFEEGETIFEKGDSRDYAYIIESGIVKMTGVSEEDGSKTSVYVSNGEIFGESALLDGGYRDATAKAVEPTAAFCISPDILKQRMENLDPMVKLLVSMLVEKYRYNRLSHIDGLAKSPSLSAKRTQELLVESYEKQRRIVLDELRMEQELRRALEKNEFKPYLQPITEFENGSIIGYETLVRWHHPHRGIVFPNDFIPIAERTNVVGAIDQCMLEAACNLIPQLHDIAGEYGKKMFISVNLSGANFDDQAIVDRVKSTLKGTKFDPSQIKLEITESALVSDAEQAAFILEQLKATGVTLALDDFGTGYSSLGYLHRFTIDSLKIDRSFVQQLQVSRKSLNIVKAVVDLAHTFDLNLIAEGIEEEKEVEILKGLGCKYGQGFYFGRPVEAQETLRQFSEDISAKQSTGLVSAE